MRRDDRYHGAHGVWVEVVEAEAEGEMRAEVGVLPDARRTMTTMTAVAAAVPAGSRRWLTRSVVAGSRRIPADIPSRPITSAGSKVIRSLPSVLRIRHRRRMIPLVVAAAG